ncbi:hypothetical protein [Photobacterium rosenbergii]|uniref:hypothetical protein n=1 Tax=Photobacterium rosenbergii TaxID=294936 RepID=UPI001C994D68|nr:hypothetical protein [Photobacterium rosenbergii]MBY5946242.1 hypothetical protein [Photobacterium rosenbergii]
MIKVCSICSKEFAAKRKDAKYCGNTCKVAAKRAKKRPTKEQLKAPKQMNLCEYCGAETLNKHYCNRTCQQKATEQRHKANATKCFHQTRFGMYLLSNLRRAGTVETLQVVDSLMGLRPFKVADFYDLLSLYKGLQTANGIGNRKEIRYHLCHISPVAGKEHVGLLNDSNLLIAAASLNQSLGAFEPEHHQRIARSELSEGFKIAEGDSDAVILQKANRFLGGSLIAFVKEVKLTPPQRSAKAFEGYSPKQTAEVLETELVRMNFTHNDPMHDDLWGFQEKLSKGKFHGMFEQDDYVSYVSESVLKQDL